MWGKLWSSPRWRSDGPATCQHCREPQGLRQGGRQEARLRPDQTQSGEVSPGLESHTAYFQLEFVPLAEEQEFSYSNFPTQLGCYLLQNPPQTPGGRARSPGRCWAAPPHLMSCVFLWCPFCHPSLPGCELGEKGAQVSAMAVGGRGGEVGAHPGSRWQLGAAVPRELGVQTAGYPHAPQQSTWPPWDPHLGGCMGPVGRAGQRKGKAAPRVSPGHGVFCLASTPARNSVLR